MNRKKSFYFKLQIRVLSMWSKLFYKLTYQKLNANF